MLIFYVGMASYSIFVNISSTILRRIFILINSIPLQGLNSILKLQYHSQIYILIFELKLYHFYDGDDISTKVFKAKKKIFFLSHFSPFSFLGEIVIIRLFYLVHPVYRFHKKIFNNSNKEADKGHILPKLFLDYLLYNNN